MAFLEHETYLTIRDIDKDTNITNKAILSMFEDIGGHHSDKAGYGLKDIEKSKISWVLLNWKVKVLKRIKYSGATIKVKTWSRGSVRACCFRDYELYDENGNLCAIATSKWTLYHLEKGLIRLTDEIMEKYETEDKTVFENYSFEKIKEPENYSSCYEYTVERSDIDINNHMHNLRYLDLAYEALPENIYSNYTFDNVEIMYKNGAFAYQNLKCLYCFSNNEHIITIKSEDEKTLHAIIKLY